jgi:hypothetical protein
MEASTQGGKVNNYVLELVVWVQSRMHADDGMTTAELLGNAALAIGVLVVLWAGLKAMGTDIIAWIGDQVKQ